MRINNLFRKDSYKDSHWLMMPEDAVGSHAYVESRGGMFNKTVQFGGQYYLKEYLQGQFFTREDIFDAEQLVEGHFGQKGVFNTKGWLNVYEKLGGALPLRIKGIPEGHVVETHNALYTLESTLPEFVFGPNWIETLWLKVWYPITVATLSREIRQIIGKALVKTGDPALLPFKLHDFGYRGVSSEESAGIGGMAHLVNFQGTDTQIALPYARHFYGHPMAGYTIPAAEHTTIISWGKDFEIEAYRNILRKFPVGLVAVVSDSYDLDNAVRNIWGDKLREEVISRNGTLVVRPDSGDPLTVVLRTLETLWERFGGETNSKGYRVLAPSVRVIQGDGINFHSINQIVRGITDAGWSMDNLALGMGGALLQQLNRDTQRFAIKISAIDRGKGWVPVFKNPKTDPTKASKGGRFMVTNGGGKFVTIPKIEDSVFADQQPGEMLETIFEDGRIVKEYNLSEIRRRVSSYDEF